MDFFDVIICGEEFIISHMMAYNMADTFIYLQRELYVAGTLINL